MILDIVTKNQKRMRLQTQIAINFRLQAINVNNHSFGGYSFIFRQLQKAQYPCCSAHMHRDLFLLCNFYIGDIT